jgi:hypothetical protein
VQEPSPAKQQNPKSEFLTSLPIGTFRRLTCERCFKHGRARRARHCPITKSPDAVGLQWCGLRGEREIHGNSDASTGDR